MSSLRKRAKARNRNLRECYGKAYKRPRKNAAYMDFFDTGFLSPQVNCGLFIAAMVIGVLGICAGLLQ